MTRRTFKGLEVCAGLGSALLSVALLRTGAQVVDAAPPPAAARAAPAHTPRDATEPTPIGAAFESDAALPAHATKVASYELRARLDPQLHTITGSGSIEWTNTSSLPTAELWLHLYLNAFKNERTLFLRSPFGAGRSSGRAEDWGYIDVQRLVARELGNVDLWPSAARSSPGDPDDQTDIRVPLPAPVLPGAKLTLDVEFTAKLPAVLLRTGYAGSFHFAGQWFPKLARREPDGTWAHFPFHPQSEFYADFGRYVVTLDVPEQFTVGATGVRTQERVEKGRRIVRHEADDVHDFAWTAWDGFERREETISGVRVLLLQPPGNEHNGEVTLRALRFALPHFSARYGAYPYPVLTVVHPPEPGKDAGGMEYPTLITTGGAWYLGKSGVRGIEAVTIHELGHQWFYGLVATNEHAHPFLDEGLNTYAETVAMAEAWGSGSLIDWPSFSVSGDAIRRAVAAEYAGNNPLALPASKFATFRELGALVYARTGTVFRTFERVYGEPVMRRALARYTRRYRYAHPGPKHLIAAYAEVAGDEPAEMLRRALLDRGTADYRVESVDSAPAAEPAGVYDRDGGRSTVARPSRDEDGAWVGKVIVRRDGTLALPVVIELRFADGSRQRRRWDGQGSWTALDYRGEVPLEAAIVDPDARVLLDDNLLNNSARRGAGSRARLTERALYVSELLLGAFGP
jgi:hypothetical protein